MRLIYETIIASCDLSLHCNLFFFIFSSHNNRVFLNNQKARTLLTKYATTGVSREQVAELKRSLRLYQPVLLRLLNSFISEGYETKCPVVYADFLLCLGSDFPVCGLIHHHPGFVDMLRDVAAGIDVTTDPNNFILLEQQMYSSC